MRIAIVGAGAVGTLLGAHICPNATVCVIDRGERFQVLKEHGLRLVRLNGSTIKQVPDLLTDSFEEAGPQDYVFLAVKAYDLPVVAKNIKYLMSDETSVVTLQNGIPWWYFHNHPQPYENINLKSLDPENVLAKHIDPNRIIGCVAYPAAELLEDGSVRHVEGLRFPVGELDGRIRARTETLVQLLEEAGFRSRAISDIRAEYWLKAWGALSINPVSALTRAKMDEICTFGPSRQLVATMMKEAENIAKSLGVTFRHSIEKRIEGAKAVGPHKTSMLCDLEAGSRLETEALIGSIVELAQITKQPVPAIEAVYACLSLLAINNSANSVNLDSRPDYN
jgi:ketopantoate reductase